MTEARAAGDQAGHSLKNGRTRGGGATAFEDGVPVTPGKAKKSYIVKPRDEETYVEFVKGFCMLRADDRNLEQFCKTFRNKLEIRRRNGSIAWVPSNATLMRWAYQGTRTAALGGPRTLRQLAEDFDKGKLDLNAVVQRMGTLKDDADDVMRAMLNIAVMTMQRKDYQDKCAEDPRLLSSMMQRVNEISARLSIRGNDIGTLEQTSRETAIEIIGKLLELHPDLVKSVAKCCEELIKQGADGEE